LNLFRNSSAYFWDYHKGNFPVSQEQE